MKYQKNRLIYTIFSKEEIKKMDLQKNKECYIIKRKVKKSQKDELH